jgi:tetratricopeptide (TPR) repeat protein
MPALARLLFSLVTLTGGWYALFVSPALSGAPTAAAEMTPEAPDRGGPSGGSRANGPATPADAELVALLETSNAALTAERWNEALAPTKALVDRYPGQHVYLSRLAGVYRNLGRPSDEAATWELFMDRSPLPAEACPFIGHAYRRLGRLNDAVAAFERCAAADPLNAELAFFVGLGHEWSTKFDAAETWYRKATEMSPPHYDSLVGLARINLHRNRLDTAVAEARKVLTDVPLHVDSLLVAGLAEQRADHRREARQYLEKAVGLAADYFDVQLALGMVDYSDQRYREAHDRFATALRLDPSRRAEVQPWLDRAAVAKAAP